MDQINEMVIDGLTNRYEAILIANIETKKALWIRRNGAIVERMKDAPKEDDYSNVQKAYCEAMVSSTDREAFLKTSDWDVVVDRSKEYGSYYISYRCEYEGKLTFNQAKYAYIPSPVPSIVIAIRTRHNGASDYHSSFGGNAMIAALTSDFGSVSYVNFETGNETLLQIDPVIHKNMKGVKSGPGYYEHCKAYADRMILPDDRDRYLKAVEPSHILRHLDREKSYSVDYRVILPGFVDRVFRTKFVRDPNFPQGKCVVCGVRDVTDEARRAEKMNAQIQRAYSAASVDSLTGIRNRRAFDESMDKLQAEIAKDPNGPHFAIGVFDVNGLKEVNDTLGHQAGDDYLILSCKLICDTYKHSPVFRIGGDEFAVILKDKDYENRRALLYKIRGNAENVVTLRGTEFRLSVACGLAAYDPSIDPNIRHLFNRADTAMYEDKHSMKGITFR